MAVTANGGRRWPEPASAPRRCRPNACADSRSRSICTSCFAPLKHARLDYLVQKAVEMGVSRLQPVMTKHTQVSRLNLDRMRANAIEAAQQCGVLHLPEIMEPAPFRSATGNADAGRILVFCDEAADVADPLAALAEARPQAVALLPAEAVRAALPLAVLIGPEGGFSEEEREALRRRPNVVRLALGPRILRADTAAVAALALVQAVLGDWREAHDLVQKVSARLPATGRQPAPLTRLALYAQQNAQRIHTNATDLIAKQTRPNHWTTVGLTPQRNYHRH